MSRYYDESLLPDEMRRNFDVYDRIRELGLPLGTFDENVVSLANAGIAGVVFQESGLVYLSGTSGGTYPMNDDDERIKHGIQGAQDAADVLGIVEEVLILLDFAHQDPAHLFGDQHQHHAGDEAVDPVESRESLPRSLG